MRTVEFFLTFHFQDHRAQVRGRLIEGFILVGVTRDYVRDVGQLRHLLILYSHRGNGSY